jgi:putative hemolysin
MKAVATELNQSGIKSLLTRAEDVWARPVFEFSEGRYTVRLARTNDEIDAALRLRFAVFNLELGEGLEASYITGRDEDRFDAHCDHLIAIENETNEVVGTYRLQTLEMAGLSSEFYCAGEFELENLPSDVLGNAIEIGRACIAREHRYTRVLLLLWKGLKAYATAKQKRYFFGCCSLTSQNPEDGVRAERLLAAERSFDPELFIAPRPDFVCQAEVGDDVEFSLPKLFKTYLKFGATVCSTAAIDREFKTIDFFVMFDLRSLVSGEQ